MKPAEDLQLDCQFVHDLHRLHERICYISYLDMHCQLWQSIQWRWHNGTDFEIQFRKASGSLHIAGVPRHVYDRNIRSPEPTIRLSSFGSLEPSSHY